MFSGEYPERGFDKMNNFEEAQNLTHEAFQQKIYHEKGDEDLTIRIKKFMNSFNL